MALSHSSQNSDASAQQHAKNEAFLDHVKGVIASVYTATTKDGHLAAFGRQGVDEIGMALRAFPDSIQAQEHGTIFDPTPGEIASGRSTSIYGDSFVKGTDRGEEQEVAGKWSFGRGPAGKGSAAKDSTGKGTDDKDAAASKEKPDFLKDILDRKQSGDGGNSGYGNAKPGYERAKERSLADEQKGWADSVKQGRDGGASMDERDRPGGRSH